MDHFNRFKQQLSLVTVFALLAPGVVGTAAFVLSKEVLGLDTIIAAAIGGGLYLIVLGFAYAWLHRASTEPLHMVWQAVWHVSPDRSDVPPPRPDDLRSKAAHELVSALVGQIYTFASNQSIAAQAAPATLQTVGPAAVGPVIASNDLLESIPMPLIILDKDWMVKAANRSLIQYIGLTAENVMNKSVYDVLNMSFKEESDTLDQWLTTVKGTKATDTRSWEQVRLSIPDGTTRQFDLAASYSQADSAGNELVLALFDRSKSYSTEDQATSYVAMAVHELRTPLTMLRGYVEMFEDELGPTLSEEHKEFMRKMSASAQSLTAFVGNILNIARIDENALVLKLQETDWPATLQEMMRDMELRAQVRGKRLHLNIAEGLPHVATDRLSITEVVTNLVENAIKYSGQSPDITVHVGMNKEGLVETIVEDHGVGIPESVIGGLFTKYYRSHRSKNAVSGTGLGLYLVKAIVTAHGGNVSVSSKEGEGSRFSFTLLPYDQVKDQAGGPDGIERQAGGWIKNHSLYRR